MATRALIFYSSSLSFFSFPAGFRKLPSVLPFLVLKNPLLVAHEKASFWDARSLGSPGFSVSKEGGTQRPGGHSAGGAPSAATVESPGGGALDRQAEIELQAFFCPSKMGVSENRGLPKSRCSFLFPLDTTLKRLPLRKTKPHGVITQKGFLAFLKGRNSVWPPGDNPILLPHWCCMPWLELPLVAP